MGTINLGTWLLEQGNAKRKPGAFDCCTLPADWAVANGWPDPMAEYRAAYATYREATDILEQEGGLLALFEAELARIGMLPRDEPQLGDIGLIMFGEMTAGAIYTGEKWTFVAGRGLGFCAIPRDNIKGIWAVDHG